MLTLHMMEILDGEQTAWVSVPELLHYGGGFSSGMFFILLKARIMWFSCTIEAMRKNYCVIDY